MSVSILQRYQPAVLESLSPRSTVGDGNCGYRAVAMGMYGDQKHHDHVRLLTALEMIGNPSHYDIAAADYTATIVDNRIMTSGYQKLIDDVTTDGGYVELIHLYAISAALGVSIQSFMPNVSWEQNPYIVAIYGRGVKRTQSPAMMVMWTSTVSPTSTAPFHANHIVFMQCRSSAVPSESVSDVDDDDDEMLKHVSDTTLNDIDCDWDGQSSDEGEMQQAVVSAHAMITILLL